MVIKGGIFVVLVIATFFAFPNSELYQYNVAEGDYWRHETLKAPFDFAIYKDARVIESERRNVRYSTPPFFREVPDAQAKMQAKRDTVKIQLERIFQAYDRYWENLSRDSLAWAEHDSLHIQELKRTAFLRITPYHWGLLVDSYRDSKPVNASSNVRQEAEPRLDEELLSHAWDIGQQLISIGILDIPLDSVLTNEIYIRREEESIVVRKNKENVFGINEAFTFAQEQSESKYEGNPQHAKLAGAFFRAIFQHSLSYLRAETYREWARKEQRISPTRGMVQEGETIVNNGELVTPEIEQQITSLKNEQQARSGQKLSWKISLGQLVLAITTFLIFFLYLFVLRRQIFQDNRHVLLIALLFLGMIGSFAIAVRLPWLGMYAVPVAVVPVMLTVMFDSRVALFGLLTLSFLGGHFLGFDFEFTFATFFAGALGVFSVRDIKNRGQIFLSAASVAFGYAVVLGAGWLLYDVSLRSLSDDLFLVMLNSAQLIMALPLLWVFERAFDITTDLTLLELSDTNRPLLKELSIRAPGTFNHSLQVANLAEAAADSIGANALLARVGALYHDTGKMIKPEYFVENQRSGGNPHDQLKPRMSALIIASHVKEGLEIGRNYNLPKRVLDFVPMHHGTMLIEYFYRRAIENENAEQGAILESEFRYPGPRPNSRETGILMLADSVEAASRTINEPTHKRLEGLIEAIFRARVNDGQLDKTDLTFSDLHKIKETFLAMLLGIHHGRVKYPGQDDEALADVPEIVENASDAHPQGDGGAENLLVNGDGGDVVVKS